MKNSTYAKLNHTWEPAGFSRHTPTRRSDLFNSRTKDDRSLPPDQKLTADYLKKLAYVHGGVLVVLLLMLLLYTKKEPKANGAVNVYSLSPSSAKDTGIAKVLRLAEAFKATLKDEQVSSLQLAYSKQNAARWSNFPQAFSHPNRVGLALGSLSPTQLAAAKTLMAAVLSQGATNEGYDELEGILAADDYFGKTTGKTDVFGSRNYFIAFLGTPSTTALWELQFGGHHFAFADTYNAGKIIGVTPSFRGVEPMAPVTVNGRTYQPIDGERAAFAQMIASLSDAQKSSAKLSVSFTDVLLGPGKDGMFPATKNGLRVGDLNSVQQKAVTKAIELYVGDLDAATAKGVMTNYTAQLAATYIAYSGSGTMDKANDYVRIDGPNVWIEYSVQPSRDFPGTTHPHSVWRDRKSDYGGN